MQLKMMAIFGAVLGSMLIWAGSADAEERFTDLQHSKWAEDGIEYMAERGTVAGYGNGIFKPQGLVTRAQAVTFMVRELYPQQLEKPVEGTTTYSDVPTTHPFYREIAIASKNGLASGFPGGSFRPDAPLSRAETAAFLTRAYSLLEGKQPANWTDTKQHWAEAPILILSSNGLVGGYSDGTYRPNQTVTRAEYAVFMSRVIRFEREAAIRTQDWDKLISYMTVSEQVGQMLMPDIRQWNGKVTTTVNEGLKRSIHDQDLGGLILFDKNIVDIRQLTTFTHDMQREAGDIPLFLSIDQEGGVVKRIPGGTNLAGQMALGATGDTALAEAAGQLTGEELKALGIQINFAPVLDINSNPDNPIIGIRSFGSDADLVTRLGLATIKGLQQSGVIAAVKHFPGHGDTTADSHLGMPVLTHNRARLDAVELKPFRDAIENGVEMIMTAHIAFPAIDNEHVTSLKDGKSVPIPATLSKKVLTGLLRGELRYEGLIISDAFTMNAIAEHFGENKAVERAVSSGVDIILMPKDPAAAHQTLVNAVKSGKIPDETIHTSVKRILELKAKYGLFERSQTLAQKLNALNGVIGSKQHRAVEQEIAERAVTVLAGREGGLPDQIQQGDRVVILAAEQEQAKQLEKQLMQAANNLSLKPEISLIGKGKVNEALQAIGQADYVILASYQFRNVASEFGWSDYQTLIDTMNRRNQRYSLMSLGNPYEIIYLQNVRSGLAVYGKQEPNTLAGIKVLVGQRKAEGKLPVRTE
ncbi:MULTISPECIES: glycoside hydrolase family 3 N-terminal domain-containing protein [Paenibacillus]|uniref:beta-N-acetylhexosaminidase n=1 Tax=Paenibacillus pabuli TaxID=1472 RepID=A0A855Y237_9BACL|nr:MULTISPECIES: glycoside hydrolase family 3 N-terminal domain-containing protein [Paenibacillus]PWW36162.1 beta-N-acetylhexosaminidase [Paenibacillus pabuli]PXW03241.1 beta-N-acetylhexosaminidase [Paenibacillus taichungensis]